MGLSLRSQLKVSASDLPWNVCRTERPRPGIAYSHSETKGMRRWGPLEINLGQFDHRKKIIQQYPTGEFPLKPTGEFPLKPTGESTQMGFWFDIYRPLIYIGDLPL